MAKVAHYQIVASGVPVLGGAEFEQRVSDLLVKRLHDRMRQRYRAQLEACKNRLPRSYRVAKKRQMKP